jgi:hypothetical protein
MRHALIALLAMGVVLSVAGLATAAAPPEKAEAEKAPADGEKTEKTDDDTKPVGKVVRGLHLDLDDIKDLRDAEIELPDIKDADEDPDLTVEEIVEQLRKQAEGKAAGDEAELGEEDEEEINPVEVVKDIIDGMDDSAERLGQKVDPGTETQGVQKKVDDDLSKLIRYVKQKQQQQQQSQGKGKGKQSKKDSQRSKGGRKQGRRPGQGRGKPKTSRAQQPAQDEQATKGQAQQAELDAVSKMAVERWGDLLQNAPRETLQAIPDMFLEKYRGLLGRYFYALAQQQAAAREDNQ